MESNVERAARNEAVFRDANELIERQLSDLSLVEGRSPFVCECDDPSCAEIIRLTLAEYEWVRSSPTRFAIAPGHTAIAGEIVRRSELYEVVEKQGKAAEIAEERDPRSE
jgi:hypothetical protein